ncbi:MAG: BamA/TamA family outer membrane protein, partial [Sphingobium sp.]
RTISSVGYSLIYDRRDNRIRPTSGFYANLSQDVAGLGGDVRYVRTRIEGGKYLSLGGGFIFSLRGEAGHIKSLEGQRFDSDGVAVERVRLTDRFYLGEPQMRGFAIRGVGPRVRRQYYDASGALLEFDSNSNQDDALGGKIYYLAHAEVEIPLGAGARELGLRPAIFMDAGAVGNLQQPGLYNGSGIYNGTCTITDSAGTFIRRDGATTPGSVGCTTRTGTEVASYDGNGFREQYLGDTLKPRLSVGVGVNWNSPFGPFRIDIAKVLLKEPGDDTKTITFNIGTQF